MISTPENVCEICGVRIETTGSGDVGCLVCSLGAGLDGLARESGQAPEEVPEAFGTYRITRHEDGSPWQLGRGTMGATYCAEDISLRRRVALKIINADFAQQGAEARERFVREARAAASLRHPNIATVYQFGIDEETGQCFCAMEYIDGETLEERVRRSGPLEAAMVIEIARQIVSALILAEKQKVVHRDLKPGNVMIATVDEPEKVTVKIIDFGLAKALGETGDGRALTQGGFVGTPAFASPEQLQRTEVDGRSDIYSLGTTLWFLLTAQMPFGDQVDGPPPVAQLKAAHVAAWLVALLKAMLAREPAARPSAREILTRLEAPARPRYRGAVLAALGIFLLALGVGIYFYRPPGVPPSMALLPAKSIAVLPFENLSDAKKGSSSFADGVQDELLTDLARIADLKVVSRTSVLQYRGGAARNLREIGQQLGVAFVVEGTAEQIGQRVRISAQLIDARTDLHRWAQTFERPLDDVFAIQSEIAQAIADQLDAKISPHEKAAIEEAPTHDLAAYDLYTHASALLARASATPLGKQNLYQAAQLLAEAVARDPNFLLAWCQLANAHDMLYFLGFDRTATRLSLGDSAIEAATNLQPDAGETHLARARHFYQGYLDYDSALRELTIARRILPNDPNVFVLGGYIARRQGKWKESAQRLANALALDPRNIFILEQIAASHSLQRQYADAANFIDRALLIAPDEIELRLARAQVNLNGEAETRPLHAVVATLLAKNPEAASDLAGAWLTLALDERDDAAVERASEALGDGNFGPDAIQLRRPFWEGLAARMRGDKIAAQSAFATARAEQERKVVAAPDFAPALSILALIDAGLGRKAEAIRAGLRATGMLPVARDAINGAHLLEFLAMIYAWSGEREKACEELAIATKIPGTLSYGQLRLSPMWDDLRGYPPFEKIVATLAPDR